MRFGIVPFVNMAPYYHFLSDRWLQEHQVSSGTPRQLGVQAKAGRLDVAPFSYVDGLELVRSGEFEWLGSMGICGQGPIQSILLVGATHAVDLAGREISVTPQTATTVRLMEVWLRQRHKVTDYRLVEPASPTPFRLVIGDEALRRRLEYAGCEPQIDLCEEWGAWTGKPFVFARWAIRASLPSRDKLRMAATVRSGLDLALGDLEDVSRAQEERCGLPKASILAYLKGIRFALGPQELAGAQEFEDRLERLHAES
jgi:predicted solute-binding protein